MTCGWVLETDNGMVRFLSGDGNPEEAFINRKPFGTIDEVDLEKALHNIERHFSCVGFVEYFEESMLLFDHHPEIVAEIADFLMRVEGIELVLGLGCYGEEGVLSLRTSHQETHAGMLMQTVIKGLGTGGGHSMTAGGQIRPLEAVRGSLGALEYELTGRLLAALGREHTEPEPLVSR